MLSVDPSQCAFMGVPSTQMPAWHESSSSYSLHLSHHPLHPLTSLPLPLFFSFFDHTDSSAVFFFPVGCVVHSSRVTTPWLGCYQASVCLHYSSRTYANYSSSAFALNTAYPRKILFICLCTEHSVPTQIILHPPLY